MTVKFIALMTLCSGLLSAQVPESANVFLYFPQLADGGPRAQQWQTSLRVLNPNPATVSVVIDFFTDAGGPLKLDFGSGAASKLTFSVPPFGAREYRSKIVSPDTVIGWAFGSASLPVQANIAYRAILNGTPSVEITANATLPTTGYVSAGNRDLGIAIANTRIDASNTINVLAFDSDGQAMGTQSITLPPVGHSAFNLWQKFPGIGSSFTGTVVLQSTDPNRPFVAWTLNAELGLLSTLPEGRAGFPVSQNDRIWKIFSEVQFAAQNFMNFGPQLVNLSIINDQVINAFGGGNSVQIHSALAELINDSPSELAFIIAHELGHVNQSRKQALLFYPGNIEFDADIFGMMTAIGAGYDPYAGAGALAKLAMVTGSAGLVTQFESQLSPDAHKSFNERIESMFTLLNLVCSQNPVTSQQCSTYKAIHHPHFPGSAPLSITPPPAPKQ